MARMVKNTTIRHNEMVGEDELLLRRVGLSIPEFYRLTPYQMTQIDGYVDKSYTKVRLKDGTVIATRDAMRMINKVKPAPSKMGLYGRTKREAFNLSMIFSKLPTYQGLRMHQVTFTWYHQAGGGKLTIRDPRNPNEYLVECYAFCDNEGSWRQLRRFIEVLFRLMIHSVCDMHHPYEKIDRAEQFHNIFYKGKLRTTEEELSEEIEAPKIPMNIERILLELDDLGFTDDGCKSDENEIRALLTLMKLVREVGYFVKDKTDEMWEAIGDRYSKKPYMESLIKEVIVGKRDLEQFRSYPVMIKQWTDGGFVQATHSDLILGAAIWQRMTINDRTPIVIKRSDIKNMPDCPQTRRIKHTLGLMNVRLA